MLLYRLVNGLSDIFGSIPARRVVDIADKHVDRTEEPSGQVEWSEEGVHLLGSSVLTGVVVHGDRGLVEDMPDEALPAPTDNSDKEEVQGEAHVAVDG